ncbi:hypothetical protein VNO78_19682 [Psophocarpus tetragonolobus]|uniref:BZIP domain-containing protein n=1 Tax=Psophocarpus tetragonolobus TaxID=3891 RepID=A0AAN9XGT7_PSOTE
MDQSKFPAAAPVSVSVSDTAEFEQILQESDAALHHQRTFSDDSLFLAGSLDDLLPIDFRPFDLEMLNSSLPLSPPPPPTDAVILDMASSHESNPAGPERGKAVVSSDLAGADGGRQGGGDKKWKRRPRNGISVDDSSATSFETGTPIYLGKRAMNSEQLAELARVDPKRVKRILANRESAARSKEKKTRYVQELQTKVQLLGTKVTNGYNNVSMLEGDITRISVHIKALTIQRDALQQQVRIKEALNEAIKEEGRSLRNEIAQYDVMLSYPCPRELLSQFSSQLDLRQFHNPLSQQHLHPKQRQLSMTNPFTPSTQSFKGHYGPNFSNFNKN